MRFRDRSDAGRVLAAALRRSETLGVRLSGDQAGPGSDRPGNGIVLGVPRGGVIVAAAVAAAMRLPLDLALSRKIGAPGHPELAIGAVAENGEVWLVDDLIHRLRIDSQWLDSAIAAERQELERRAVRYRGSTGAPSIGGKVAVVVDDGVATGATLAAVLATLRRQHPAWLIAAIPVAPPDAVSMLSTRCDEVVCPLQPERFDAVGSWYDDFAQTTDEEVVATLARG